MNLAPLILLPGMMCDHRLFAPQLKALSDSREVRVERISEQASIEELASNLLEKLPAEFALAGLSMGGIVAMEICKQAPERIKRLALMDTNHQADTYERKRIRDDQIKRVRNGDLRAIMRDEMKPSHLADSEQKSDILDLCMLMAESLGDEVFIKQSQALRDRQDYTETLKLLQVPSLVLCGEQDFLCSIEKHKDIHDLIPNSTLRVIKRAGHLPTLEQAEQTNRALGEWLI